MHMHGSNFSLSRRREEAAPLIEAAYQQRLVEEKLFHEREQQLEVELSKQRHDGNLQEKNTLACMLDNKTIFQEKVMSCQQVEYARLRQESEERIHKIRQSRKQDMESKQKIIYFLKPEGEILNRLHEEEEARKREEAERKRKEEAERKAKLDEITEKQRLRELELEGKARLQKQQLLPGEPAVRPYEPPARSQPDIAAPAAAPGPGKYMPQHLRERASQGADSVPTPAPEPER